MTPPCYNRAQFTDPNAGWRDTGKMMVVVSGPGRKTVIPILRYRWPWFTDRCTVHDRADIGPNQTYAQFHGWDCTGCKWEPPK